MLGAGRPRATASPSSMLNQVGGNDELIFDGSRVVVDAGGSPPPWAAAFAPRPRRLRHRASGAGDRRHPGSEEEDFSRALVLGLRDYARKCGFQTAVPRPVGRHRLRRSSPRSRPRRSGAENVLGVLMPSPLHARPASIEDAAPLADNLGIRFAHDPHRRPSCRLPGAPWRPPSRAAPPTSPRRTSRPASAARSSWPCRTSSARCSSPPGNKSELAVGYCTLYGDMCGRPGRHRGRAQDDGLPPGAPPERAGRGSSPSGSSRSPRVPSCGPTRRTRSSLPPYEVLDPDPQALRRGAPEPGRDRRRGLRARPGSTRSWPGCVATSTSAGSPRRGSR